MRNIHGIRALAVVAACIATPALAQPSTAARSTSHSTVTSVPRSGTTATAGRLQQSHGGWRSSRIVGASVYNDQNQSIGTVSDLIVGQDGKITDAVISVGGFLGVGGKLVSVPFDQLRFTEKSTAVGGGPVGTGPMNNGAVGTGANTPMGVGAATGIPPANGAGTGTGSAANTAGATGPGVGAVGAGVPVRPGPANLTTTRLELPGATRDSLRAMPSFSYNG